MRENAGENMISTDELARLGVDSVAYVRSKVVDNRKMWFVYAAQGAELACTDDENQAISLIFDNKLIPVSVH